MTNARGRNGRRYRIAAACVLTLVVAGCSESKGSSTAEPATTDETTVEATEPAGPTTLAPPVPSSTSPVTVPVPPTTSPPVETTVPPETAPATAPSETTAPSPAPVVTTAPAPTMPSTSAAPPRSTLVERCTAYEFEMTLPWGVCTQSYAVAVLQTTLVELGYDIEADAYFGPSTERAVRQFQQFHGLPVTGIVDLRTWAEVLDGVPLSGDDTDGDGIISPDELILVD